MSEQLALQRNSLALRTIEITALLSLGAGLVACSDNNNSAPNTNDSTPTTAPNTTGSSATSEQSTGPTTTLSDTEKSQIEKLCPDGIFNMDADWANSLEHVGDARALYPAVYTTDAKGNVVLDIKDVAINKWMENLCKDSRSLAAFTGYVTEPRESFRLPDSNTIARVEDLNKLFVNNESAALDAVRRARAILEFAAATHEFAVPAKQAAEVQAVRDSSNNEIVELKTALLQVNGLLDGFQLGYNKVDASLSTEQKQILDRLFDLIIVTKDGTIVVANYIGEGTANVRPDESAVTTVPVSVVSGEATSTTAALQPTEGSATTTTQKNSSGGGGSSNNDNGNDNGNNTATTNVNNNGGGGGSGQTETTIATGPDTTQGGGGGHETPTTGPNITTQPTSPPTTRPTTPATTAPTPTTRPTTPPTPTTGVKPPITCDPVIDVCPPSGSQNQANVLLPIGFGLGAFGISGEVRKRRAWRQFKKGAK